MRQLGRYGGAVAVGETEIEVERVVVGRGESVGDEGIAGRVDQKEDLLEGPGEDGLGKNCLLERLLSGPDGQPFGHNRVAILGVLQQDVQVRTVGIHREDVLVTLFHQLVQCRYRFHLCYSVFLRSGPRSGTGVSHTPGEEGHRHFRHLNRTNVRKENGKHYFCDTLYRIRP